MKQPLAVGFVVGAALKLEFLWVMKELSYRCGAPPCTEHVLTLRVIPSCQDHQAAMITTLDPMKYHTSGPGPKPISLHLVAISLGKKEQ